MAEKDLIGFDPLAWMGDSEETEKMEAKEQPAVEKIVAEDVEVDVVIEKPEAVEEDTPELVLDTEKNDAKLILDATLNIQNVNELSDQLEALLDNQDKIEIDASAVVAIDTASLQLLTILKRTAIQEQKEVIFDFPSDKFIEAAGLLGLDKILEVDQSAAGLF